MISPEEIHKKELDTEHHDEYRASKKTPEKIKDFIQRLKTMLSSPLID